MLKKLRDKINQDKVEPLTPERQKSVLISAVVISLSISLIAAGKWLDGAFTESIFLFVGIIICVSTAIYAAANHKLSDKQRQRWYNTNLMIAAIYGLIYVFLQIFVLKN
ncbi:hypothetical protein ACKLNO_05835 [Neisseriaceae bacterium B1]